MRSYLDSGGLHCPFCNCTDVEADPAWCSEGLEAWVQVECLACKSRWREIFRMTGIEKIGEI